MLLVLQGEHKTLLLKPDGSRFTKTFQWDGPANALDLAAASAALQPQKPDDYASAAAAQMGSLTSQQSACDGCIGADTRVAVPAATAKKFPYTAVGAPAAVHVQCWPALYLTLPSMTVVQHRSTCGMLRNSCIALSRCTFDKASS